MIAAILLLALAAQADPGRVFAGATLGSGPGAGLLARGTLDYGIARHLVLTSELGLVPATSGTSWGAGPGGEAEPPQVALGSGVLFAPVDGRWWRAGLVAFPEVVLPGAVLGLPDVGTPLRGRPLGVLDATLVVRTGLRVNWLLFWGLTVTARVDQVFPFTGEGGWTEAAGGLAVRM